MIQMMLYVVTFVVLACYAYVLYQMFVNADTIVGVVCLVGFLVCGLGVLVAFVYGWIKAWEWEMVPVMATWSACIGINIVLSILQAVMQT